MYTEYEEKIAEEDLNYQQAERVSDVQLPASVNTLLLSFWIVICLAGFFVMFVEKAPVAGTVIIAIPTFFGMIIKPTFALCVFMLVLPTGGGVGIPAVFSLNRGIGIALAISFALNSLMTRPKLHIRNKALWIIILFTIWVFFASLASPSGLEMRSFFTQFQLLVLIFIVYWIIETNEPKTFIWALRSYVVGSLSTIAITFMTGAAMRSMTDVAEGERYAATAGRVIDANTLAALVTMAFFAAIYLFVRDKKLLWRVIYVIAMGLLPFMLLRIGSRGGLIALAFALMSSLLFIKQVFRKPALAALVLVMLILVSVSTIFLVKRRKLTAGVTQRLTDVEYARKGIAYRVGLIKAAVRVGSKRLMGTGVRGWFELSGQKHHPHSDFFFALGFWGAPAAILFALFVIMIMSTVRRIPLGIEKLYARTVLIYLLVMGLNINQLRFKHFWVFLIITIAIERISWLSSYTTEHIGEQVDEETADINYQQAVPL